ncbi:MAG: hypothetical protein LR015_00345 [Verrucomicrobia bacterium]|nr:hypothetical protein [Verrucomicrobiota bacterium]
MNFFRDSAYESVSFSAISYKDITYMGVALIPAAIGAAVAVQMQSANAAIPADDWDE